MISKELLTAVLGKRCVTINMGIPKHLKSENTLFYEAEADGEYVLMYDINIYELGHLVKDWIKENHALNIWSGINLNNDNDYDDVSWDCQIFDYVEGIEKNILKPILNQKQYSKQVSTF